jgi:hypothetical protein
VADRNAKGRQAKGESQGLHCHPESRLWGADNHAAKLDEAKVREIRIRRSNGETLSSIAASYSIAVQSVWSVVKKLSWPHVD